MTPSLTPRGRWIVLFAAVGGLVFDGLELGMMPVASLSITQDLLGKGYTKSLGGEWFARFTAALMLGAALGGIFLGGLGDRIGRTRALGISVLFYSVFAGMGAWAQSLPAMLVLRFLVGLGVGGVWPNAVALAAECWPDRSRPVIAGLMGAALNAGILLLSQVAGHWPVTPDSWRWLFHLAAAPAFLGIAALTIFPESPVWLRQRHASSQAAPGPAKAAPASTPAASLFRPPLLRLTLLGILVGSIPLVGAWSASKWMIPWADAVSGKTAPGYKATAQACWAVGAVLGSYFGAQIAARFGRRPAYAAISIGAAASTLWLFLGTEPLQPAFLPVVCVQGFVSTLFFGWLPLYLPELFPTHVRATGAGIAYNSGRFITAAGVFGAGSLFAALGASYPRVGAVCACVYLLGAAVIWLAPDTARHSVSS